MSVKFMLLNKDGGGQLDFKEFKGLRGSDFV